MKKELKLRKMKPYIILIILNAIIFTSAYFMFFNNYEKVNYATFLRQLNDKQIKEIVIEDKGADVVTYKYNNIIDDKKYVATGAKSTEVVSEIATLNIDIKGKVSMSGFECFIVYSIITIIIGAGINLYLKHKSNKMLLKKLSDTGIPLPAMGNIQEEMKKSFGKKIESDVRLVDVAGCDEEKLEVMEIIDFLKSPKKYKEIGATIPRGVLLVGPPGTGKTLLAKAIAGEAGVHFLYASGSEFIEKYVGVGAQRVRELFESAKKEAPAILFIDEIDAIGKQRTGAEGTDERDQTLNQLLVEMDGMEENNGLIIIAATNRPEILDKAFLRKGRFDRKVAISLPDTKGREEILYVHAKKKRLSTSVSLKDIAKKTHGFSGADLYAVLNESALLAVRNNRNEIITEDIEEAIDRVMMGHSSKSKKYSRMEKKMIAYHESGHVVLGLKMSEADQVDKVTIVPRGNAGGYAMLTPKEERFLITEDEMIEKICGLLAGRAAEMLIFKKTTTGAHNDFERATHIARSMVTQYGMSTLGLVQFEQGQSLYSGYNNITKNYSEKTAQRIDEEVEKILEECFDRTCKVLKENMDLLNNLASQLEEKETLTSKDIVAIENDLIR